MVWLVVTFNGVFYIGKSLKFRREVVLRGRTRWAVLKDCMMVMKHPTRPEIMHYPIVQVRSKYILWHGEMKIDIEKVTYKKMMKIAKKLKITERFK